MSDKDNNKDHRLAPESTTSARSQRGYNTYSKKTIYEETVETVVSGEGVSSSDGWMKMVTDCGNTIANSGMTDEGTRDRPDAVNELRLKPEKPTSALSQPGSNARSKIKKDELRRELFHYTKEKDIEKVKRVLQVMETNNWHPGQEQFRDEKYRMKVLQYALYHSADSVARYFIKHPVYGDFNLLTETCKLNLMPTGKKWHNGITCLSILAARNNTKLAEYLLKKWPDKDLYIKDHSIHIAAANGHMEFVKFLLHIGVKVDCSGPGGWTPIVYAAQANYSDIVEELLKSSVDFFRVRKNKTSECYTIVKNKCNMSIAEMLISKLNTEYAKNDTTNKYHLNSMLDAAMSRSDNEGINIVKLLLDEGAKVPNITALGDTSVIQQFFTNINAHEWVDEIDEDGNTALILACQNEDIYMMKLLVDRGASMNHQNKKGMSAWDFIADGSQPFINNVIEYFRTRHGQEESGTKFSSGKNSLLIALRQGKHKTVQKLLDPTTAQCTDTNNNTLFHIAAKEGLFELFDYAIMEHIQMDLVHLENIYDKTVFDIATERMPDDCTTLIVASLLTKFQKDNKLLQNKLMNAAESGDALFIQNISEAFVRLDAKTKEQLQLEMTHTDGNTTLHIAAVAGHIDIMRYLVRMNFKIIKTNNDGYTPYLEAMRKGAKLDITQIHKLYELQHKEFDIDEEDRIGNTALHWCTQRGDWGNVEKLIRYGADLAKQNNEGNSPLHLLVWASKKDDGKWQDYRQVLTSYGKLAAESKWWDKYCKDNNVNKEANQTDEEHFPMKSLAMMHLLRNVKNNGESKDRSGECVSQSVISLALSVGAVEVIDTLFDMRGIFFISPETKKYVMYDITFLTPETFPETQEKFVSCFDQVMELAEKKDDEVDNAILAAKILDTNPFKILIDSYHIKIKYLNYSFAFIHIMHMLLFTLYALPDKQIRNKNSKCDGTESNTTWDTLNSSSDPMVTSGPSHEWFFFFLIWPTLILVGFLFLRITVIRKSHKSPFELPTYSDAEYFIKKISLTWDFIKKLVRLLFPELCFLALCLSTYCWYFLFYCGHSVETYLQACASVFILGWLTTLYFFVSPEQLIYMAVANHIAFSDISRFTFIYGFILLGFGFAFHALFQLSSSVADDFESPWNTLLATFNLMVGVSSVLGDDFESNYKKGGGNPAFVYFVYLVYVVVASIVMLNLLIAMMTHSFDNCHNHARILWRVRALKLILNVIRIRQSLKITKPWSTHSLKIDRDSVDRNRWKLKVPLSMNEYDSSDRSDKIDNILEETWRLEKQLDALKYAIYSSDKSKPFRQHNSSVAEATN